MLPKKSLNYFRNIFSIVLKWTLVCSSAGFVIFLLVFPFFTKVKSLPCESQYGECPKEVNDNLGSYLGKTIFTAKNGIKKYLNTNLLVKNYSMRYAFPDILKVDVILNKPSFCEALAESKSYALIAQDGRVLSISNECLLPAVAGLNIKRSAGDTVSQNELFNLDLVQGVFEMYQINLATIESGHLTVDLPGGIKVIFPEEGDSDVLLGSLRLIYTKIQKDALGKYKQIDLRFESPVLR